MSTSAPQVAPGARHALFATRDGRRLWLMQLVDKIGTGIAAVALPWLVLAQGGSEALAGLTATMVALPYALFALFAGVVGDRVAPRRLLGLSYVEQAVGAAIVPLWALGGAPPAALVLASAFLVGLGTVFVDSAMFGALAETVAPEAFIRSQAELSIAWGVGQILGPVVGGLVIAVSSGSAAVAAQTLCFGACLLVLAFVAIPPRRRDPEGERERVRDAVRDGATVIARVPTVRVMTIAAFLFFFLVMACQRLLVPFYKESLGFDAQAVGVAVGAFGAGGILGALVITMLAARVSAEVLLGSGMAVCALAILATSQAGGIAVAVAAATVLGVAAQVVLSMLVGVRQRHAPRALQARVGVTGRAIAVLGVTLGGVALSALTGVVSLGALFVGCAIGGAAVAIWTVPAMARAGRTDAASRRESTPEATPPAASLLDPP